MSVLLRRGKAWRMSLLNAYLSGKVNKSRNSQNRTDVAGLQLLMDKAGKKHSLAILIHCILIPGISVS
jgi:hypothetical protein